jgi:ABC-2 type transport system permease protein
MRTLLVIAKHEFKSAGKERLSIALLVVFLGMVLVSSFIGWTTHHTVMSIYNETLHETGMKLLNPFLKASPLDSIKNTVIYIVLIGALLAVITGARSSVRDRKAFVVDLVFSRPVSSWSYVFGKLLGVQAWIGLVLLVAAITSWVSIWVVTAQVLSPLNTLLLLAFFALAWFFLLPFSAAGLISGAYGRYESTALLIPILFWVVVTFVIPQLGTAAHPTALLNPVASGNTTTGMFFQVSRFVLQPISLTEHFKHTSGILLRLQDVEPLPVWQDLLSIGVISLLSLGALARVSRQAIRQGLYE